MVEDGSLVFVGIDQEQHAERCALFAQWKGLEMPILWDPFNLTGSEVVPNFIAVDERGIVRSLRPDRDTFLEEFLGVDFAARDAQQAQESGPLEEEREMQPGPEDVCTFRNLHGESEPWSEFVQGRGLGGGLDELLAASEESPGDARLAFRLGVALRLRSDSATHRPGDFQAAIDHWTRALSLNPNQYIWRRRIQQYGPRMDKPYPFYSWVETAVKELRARGEEPRLLHAALTPAELAQPRRFEQPTEAPTDPDPAGRIRRDEEGLVSIEFAVAFDTSRKRPIASVHLTLRPSEALETHWNHEAGPPVQVWVGGGHPRLLEVSPLPDVPTSTEPLPLTFEVELPPGVESMSIPAHALYYVCEGREGACLYLRQDFQVEVQAPAPAGMR